MHHYWWLYYRPDLHVLLFKSRSVGDTPISHRIISVTNESFKVIKLLCPSNNFMFYFICLLHWYLLYIGLYVFVYEYKVCFMFICNVLSFHALLGLYNSITLHFSQCDVWRIYFVLPLYAYSTSHYLCWLWLSSPHLVALCCMAIIWLWWTLLQG